MVREGGGALDRGASSDWQCWVNTKVNLDILEISEGIMEENLL